ncbi:MAG TPA: outer membrane protein assembly factor BamE [Burkholderiaceae bacterium]|nr:outer membrane protein assembly factor BamE [Burkholderiaceae bacterium]
MQTMLCRLMFAWLCATLLLVGCDQKKIEQLEEGLSTEADVRRQFGEPAAIYPEADGSRVLEYPRQPEGQTNYFITIGPDGKMSALRQVLKESNFAKVSAGMSKTEVRRLLGMPARRQTYALKGEEVWDWRYANEGEARMFSVTFDKEGKVLTSSSAPDPKLDAR